MKMSNNISQSVSAFTVKSKITKTSYEKIARSVSTWPQWKKNLCNEELIISVKSKKI